MNQNFWIGFEKRAVDASFDRSGREEAAVREEKTKYDQSREKEIREREGGTGGTLQNNIAGSPAGGTV